MDQFYAALQRAALFEASGQRAAMQHQIDEMKRRNEGERQAIIQRVIALLDEAKASPDPIPEVVAAYTNILVQLEAPST